MCQTSTRCVECSKDLMLESADVGMNDLQEDVSADRERATLRSPPTTIHGPPKEDSLMRKEERKQAWSRLGTLMLATVKKKTIFSLRNMKRSASSMRESRTSEVKYLWKVMETPFRFRLGVRTVKPCMKISSYAMLGWSLCGNASPETIIC